MTSILSYACKFHDHEQSNVLQPTRGQATSLSMDQCTTLHP
jgi:hypothetical protein